MPMEWLRRIRQSLPKAPGGRKEGSKHPIYKLAGTEATNYSNIEDGPITVHFRILVAAWKLSGKKGEILLEEIEQEIREEDAKKLTNELDKLKSKTTPKHRKR